MALVANDKEIEYNGLLLTAPYYPRSFDTALDIRSSDLQRVAHSGLVAGADYLGGRTVSLVYGIAAWDAASFNAAIGAFEQAFAPGQSGELPLRFVIGGLAGGNVALINCRPRKISVPRDDSYFQWATEAQVELYATDPLIYADQLIDAQTGLSVPSGGMAFPLTFDLVFGSTGTGGIVSVTNAGTAPTAPKFHIVGPCANPSVQNVATGQLITASLTMGVGDFLDIDAGNRTVILNGTASRYSSLTSAQWFNLPPGTSQIKFAASTSTAATLDVIFRSAWI